MADTGLTPLEILEISKIVAAVSLIDKGAFKADLEKLGAEKAELERMYGVLPDVKAAKAARNTAEGLLVAEKARVAEHDEKRQKAAREIKQQQDELTAATKATEKERLELISRQRKLDQALIDSMDLQTKRQVEYEARTAALREAESKLAAERRKLDEKVKRIKETATA
jgi:hypothetical protein